MIWQAKAVKNRCVLQNKIKHSPHKGIPKCFTKIYNSACPIQKYVSVERSTHSRTGQVFSSITELSVSASELQTMNFVLQFTLRIWEGSRLITYCCACPSSILPTGGPPLLLFSIRQNMLPFLIPSASPPSNTKGLNL